LKIQAVVGEKIWQLLNSDDNSSNAGTGTYFETLLFFIAA